MITYALSGLVLATDQPLAALEPTDQPGGAPLCLRQLPPADAQPLDGWDHILDVHPPNAPELRFMRTARRDGDYLVQIHGYADFVIRDAGAALDWRSVPGAHPDDVEQLLLDVVLPMVIHRRGGMCLHASAVAHEGRVQAFAAPSGSGKSTLAGALRRRADVALLSDDGLALDVEALRQGEARVHPGRAALRLRPEAAGHLGGDLSHRLDQARAVEPRTGKTRLSSTPPTAPLPLTAIHVLAEHDAEPILEPLSRAEAMACLVHQLHRLDPDDRELLEAEMDLLARLVEAVPVTRLSYRRRFVDLPAVEALLLGGGGDDVDQLA